MVRVHGPMMSLDASGTLGKAITFSKWKGRNYVRQRVIPANPKSGAQVGRRAMFKFLGQQWDGLSDANKATWQDLADQLVAAPFNAYVSEGMTGWHNFLPPSKETPATRAANPSDNILSFATWEENRIKLVIGGAVHGSGWGISFFADEGAAVTPAVGTCIMVEHDVSNVPQTFYWTPPRVAQYTFDTWTFSTDGKLDAAAGGPITANP